MCYLFQILFQAICLFYPATTVTVQTAVLKSALELELDRYMNRIRILQRQLVAENCYSSNVKARSNRAVLNENLLTNAQLQAEIAYYQELCNNL